jgi:MoaA/NifB/PqqE/SkfB family radical SAM enzyme
MNLTYPWQLYHWHFGITSKCTLKCPRCPRTEYQDQLKLNADINLELFKKILSTELLTNTVKRITMCGDLGDPIYNKDYLDICRYIKTINPNIHLFTITNGSYKSPDWWSEFAKISNDKDTVNFSIDGFDEESNNIYRINSDWNSIMQGMEIMAQQSTAFVNWATIIFKYNQDKIARIVEQAKQIGCDAVQLTKSTKFGSKYSEAYGGSDDELEPRSEFISKTNRYERLMIPTSHRALDNKDYIATKEIHFKKIQDKYDQAITPLCLIGTQGMYVNANAVLYPCSWKGLPYSSLTSDAKHISFEDDFFTVNQDKLSLHKRSLEEVLNDPIWNLFFNNLDNKNTSWTECQYKCSSDIVNHDYAVGYETN